MDILEKFKEKIPSEIWELSKIFAENGFKLYIVGGYIRDFVLDIDTDDIDICSAATPSDVERILTNTKFTAQPVNAALGSYKISAGRKTATFDYTTFREEIYGKGHTPREVSFVSEVEKDIQRRDFTIDAMYYDLSECKLFDPCNGMQDCLEHRIRTVNERVFESDGLRIIRLVRLAYTKKMYIPKDVMDSAILHRHLLKDVSHVKVAEEMRKILKCQAAEGEYPTEHYSDETDERTLRAQLDSYNYAQDEDTIHARELRLLDALFSLRIVEHIYTRLPEVVDINLLYDSYHTPLKFGTFLSADFALGLSYFIGLLTEGMVGERAELMLGSYFGEEGLMLGRKAQAHYTLVLDGLFTRNKMTDESKFVAYVHYFFPVLSDISYYNNILHRGFNDEIFERVFITADLMKANNIPRYIGELSITSKDIKDKWPELDNDEVSSLLGTALILAVKKRNNNKEFLLEELEKFIEWSDDIW